MRTVNVGDVIDKSKFNRFYLALFLTLLFSLIFDGVELGIYGTALPVLIASTGISSTVFGFIGTLSQYAMMLGGMCFGMLSDRFGRKISLIICVLFYSAGTGMFGFSNSPVEFGFWRMIAGFGIAGVAPICVALVSEYSPVKNRVTLTTLVTVGPPFGGMLAPLLGLAFLPSGAWRALYLIGFVPLILIFFIIKYVPESMERIVKGDKCLAGRVLKKADPGFVPAPDDEYVTNTSAKPKKAALATLFKDGMLRNTLLLWVSFISLTFSLTTINTWLPKLMTDQGYPLTNSLLFTFTFALGSLPAIAISGWVVNRLGYRKAIITYLSITTALVLLMLVKTSAAILYITLFFTGGGLYGVFGLMYSYTATSYPAAYRGTGIGWAGSIGRFGASFGPMIGGLLIAANASMANRFMFLIIACLLVAAAICITFTEEITQNGSAN
jgi:AAHS family benzoate transporter-like MFS transporter